MLHPGALEHDLIQMSLVASPRKATTDLIGELPAEFARPRPHGFVAEDDAAGSEQLLHHAETKRGSGNKAIGQGWPETDSRYSGGERASSSHATTHPGVPTQAGATS